MKSLIDNLIASFERLSSREQSMVLFMVLAVLAAAIGFSGWVIRADLAARNKRIEVKLEKLEQVASLRGDYQRRLAEQNALAAEVKSNSRLRILSYLEGLSEQANVTLENASERRGGATGSDRVREEAAVVEIKKVSIDRLNAFLRAIEDGNRLVKVRELDIRRNYEDDKMLDATVRVGTFKPTEGG